MGQHVELGYGKANLSSTLVTYAVMKVEKPFKRTSGANSGKRIGSNQTHSIGRLELTGVVINTRVEHENGTILLLQTAWRRNGAPIREGALFVRLRAGAPLYRILGKVPTGRENVFGDRFTMFSGYADILNVDELKVAGIEVNRSYPDRFMQMDELEECYEISQIAPETQARPTLSSVATPEGVVLREIAQPRTRRMIFRDRS